ncbi:hypothetical protein B0A52_05584 [Exophiala mesophila]|uniref:Putative lipoate-protein ligase A n=1 Tax=Exophiala mesophila TaxID=212818 RepID=A0A438N3D1_EXOME|nr:hypothetical protein B0A52_05584 [Exophiala mesophila]
MRTALGPRLRSQTCLRLRLPSPRSPFFPHQCVTAQQEPPPNAPSLRAHCYSTNTSAVQKWPLRDLRDISRKTPLIFHLTSDNPYYNLSIEHYILVNSDPASRILLFYTNRPCVVIGRNQNPWLETDLGRLKAGSRISKTGNGNKDSLDGPLDLVRRRSGGGTVFHDGGNLNYSVTVPNTAKSFTRSLHAEMVVRALSPLAARLGFTDLKVNDRNDIVMRSRESSPETSASPTWLKVSGSAYKLTKGRALHHGTLLFSSPNLSKISSLLRGPGHDYIQAKGVESVRSKVGNLAWTDNVDQRAQTKQVITEAICTEFWDMYGQGSDQTRIPRQKGYNEIHLDGTEADERQNPDIAAGVAELCTREWTFDQTPKFDFTSPVVDGVQIMFHADRGGLLHHISLHRTNGDADVIVRALDKDELKRRLTQHPGPSHGNGDATIGHVSQFIQDAGRIRTVTNWKGLLDALFVDPAVDNVDMHIPEALVQRIEEIFPYISVGTEMK